MAKRLIGISAPSWNQLGNRMGVVPKGGKLKTSKGTMGAEQCCAGKLGRQTKVTFSSSVSNLSHLSSWFSAIISKEKNLTCKLLNKGDMYLCMHSFFHLDKDLPPEEISCFFPIVLLIRSIQLMHSSLGARRTERLSALFSLVDVPSTLLRSMSKQPASVCFPRLHSPYHPGGFLASSAQESENKNSFLNYHLWNIIIY